MENQDLSPSHSDASRPSLGFPLGTALLLIIIFSLSGIFSCCYHWDKLRSLRRSFSDDPDPDTHNSHTDIEQPPTKSKPTTHMVIFIFFSVKLISFFLCLILISFTYIFFLGFYDLKQNQTQSLPVLMPGDEMPKFIAMPCPCEPPRVAGKIEVKVPKPPKQPPRMPVPSY